MAYFDCPCLTPPRLHWFILTVLPDASEAILACFDCVEDEDFLVGVSDVSDFSGIPQNSHERIEGLLIEASVKLQLIGP